CQQHGSWPQLTF
nr:immunoglobulin light chain junction region [Macaca mulatta]MPN91007.1 immunoglobulin light chain junction region [Macaca mulatta]MPN91027.1 immunoglobulin light chain junction region [Macaca mulatta]MPN91300.1 immunoglobulin light chain junction region [Macaca mulatta]MPN92298.1 immunoglobulin light chain junction region [Macaca mulatta]